MFAATVLDAVAKAGHDVALALCQPDRPAGRGQRVLAPPVKLFAQELGIPVAQPARLREESAQAMLRALEADLMLVVAYGLLLPQAVLDIPRLGCINVHASLLPRWRGAAPIQRAIEAGDRQTGITIMQMDAGLDTGPMLLSQALAIGPTETSQSLHDQLAALGATLAVKALAELGGGALQARAQPDSGITYARKIERADTLIDWNESAVRIANRLRALDPSPGCVSALASHPAQTIKLWSARVERSDGLSAPAGTVLEVTQTAVRVACGEGAVALLELQRPGGRRQPAAEYLRGHRIAAGDQFLSPRA